MILPYNFDALETRNRIVEWLRMMQVSTGLKGVVIGISGGKDSSVAAALCVEAFGKENVHGLLMPNGNQSDIEDAFTLCDVLGIKYNVINIADTYNSLLNALEDTSDDAKVNILPRIRMTILYAYGQSHGLRVCGTGNLCERYVGYFTKWGDGACDLNPLANLTVNEVIAIGDTYTEIPQYLIHKIPNDGLSGLTDEEKLGISYEDIHNYLRKSAEVSPEIKQKIKERNQRAFHKNNPIPTFVNLSN